MDSMTKQTSARAAIRDGLATGIKVGSSDTLGAQLLKRGVKPVRALSAFYWVAAWGTFFDQTGREPRNADEVAQLLKLSTRTAYSWQQKFREVFPEYSTPATLWHQLHDQVEGDDPVAIGLGMGAAIVA